MHILIYLIFVSAFCLLFSISVSFVYMYASFHVRMLSTQSSAKNYFTEQTPCLNYNYNYNKRGWQSITIQSTNGLYGSQQWSMYLCNVECKAKK